MGAGIRIAPTVVFDRIEKRGHQSITAKCASLQAFRFKNASTLKLGKALKLITREPLQEIMNSVSICRDRLAKKRTDQGRARGYSCQN